MDAPVNENEVGEKEVLGSARFQRVLSGILPESPEALNRCAVREPGAGSCSRDLGASGRMPNAARWKHAVPGV